jgi:hypothetical protein
MSHADDQARQAEYVKTLPYQQILFDRFNNPGDPIEVAQAMLAIANAPAGQRPLRVAVPHAGITSAINAAVEPLQQALLTEVGIGDLLPAQPATV